MQPVAQVVKSRIKDTRIFLKKLCSLINLPDENIMCTWYVIRLYPNISHGDGLLHFAKNSKVEKNMS